MISFLVLKRCFQFSEYFLFCIEMEQSSAGDNEIELNIVAKL